MNTIKIKNHNSIVVSLQKALLLNEYLKNGFIKILNDTKSQFEIEITTNNEIVKQSLLK
ncbi:hypothetical protein [Aliarcobacter butzleri]|uniref:hypothetical protein n=1 Tax=Aliarcobacter butzleri TaxID=28197 RepID=UPI0021B4D28A|nr:hypothetical protein [Aliarcobacter butzleri]MCT7596128.1 hypothetical protein [Aliarcobacter butzleri]MCT7632157.1 hypothetical protein [Aliarcobacter butzleri]